jgi:diguanylate cyclase (GGDEF)-like protein/PAS domain S-box-containing protein
MGWVSKGGAQQGAQQEAAPVPMTARNSQSSKLVGRLSTPTLIVTMFVLAMSACVLGLMVWKAYDARRIALVQNENETRNLAHSLAEHATHTIQAVGVVMDDIVAFMRFRPSPMPEFNTRLREIIGNLPQLYEIVVFDERGNARYTSLASMPTFNVADRSYFARHREHDDGKLLITGPIQSRVSGEPVIALTRRLETADRRFAGVVVATIRNDYFTDFYKTFDLGAGGGISLVDDAGKVMIRWPPTEDGRDLSNSQLFRVLLPKNPTGYNLAASPFDGLIKYYAYEQLSRYPLVVIVARTEDTVLAGWRGGLRSDAAVATAMLTCIVLLAAVLAAQLRNRQRFETMLRERDARFRLIDAHIGDVVVLLDGNGVLSFVSMSVAAVLGFRPDQLLGRSCLDMVHPDDAGALRAVSKQLALSPPGLRAEFRMIRADGTLVWLEANFKYAGRDGRSGAHIVCTLRDVTRRKAMEDEVEALNCRLAELARTDGLTGLPNRRSLDGFIARTFDAEPRLAVLMIDVDDFKGFNDHFGHQAGDDALKQIGALLATTVATARGFAARYGGEEFTVVLPDADCAAAIDFAETLQAALRALGIRNPASARGYLTVSIGVAGKDDTIPDATTLLREADIALYEAKRRNRDCIVAAAAFLAEATPLAPDHPLAASPPSREAPPSRPARTA